MIAAALETPRPWDGRRLLRFLTGLAMLALAATLQLPAPVVPADPVTVTTVTDTPAANDTVTAGTVAAESAAAEQKTPAAAQQVTDQSAATGKAAQRLPAGESPRSTLSRAPPAA